MQQRAAPVYLVSFFDNLPAHATGQTPVVCIIGVYRKLTVVVGRLGLEPTQGCGSDNMVSWSGLVVNTIGGAANTTQGEIPCPRKLP
jgi:hypothetical protein